MAITDFEFAARVFTSYFLGGLLSLSTITNPPSKIPLFIGLTQGLDARETARVARRACFYAFWLLAGALLGGHLVLSAFGVSATALRVAGGITVAVLGYRMLFGDTLREPDPTTHRRNVAFFPLALPSISGPGSIAVIIGISGEIAELPAWPAKVVAQSATLASLIVVVVVMWAVLRSAQAIGRRLGSDGMEVLTRLNGFLLVCIGVQFVGSGLRSFLAGG